MLPGFFRLCRSSAMGGVGQWDKESFWRDNTLNGFFYPWSLPNWNPRPPDLTHTSTGCLLGSSNKTSITSSIVRRLDFKGHLEEIEEDHTFNTSDPHDDAVFLHNDSAKDHDTLGALMK